MDLRWTFVGKVMSLLFIMLSRLAIAFLPRSKHLLISWLQSPSTVNLETPKIKSVTVSIVSPSICHEVMRPDAMIFIFWMLSFKPAFSLSSFTFIKRLFSFFFAFYHRVESSVYLSLLIFLLAILILARASSSPAFLIMYSSYKLNKQGDNIQPWCTPFPIWNQSVVPCPVLTVASYLHYCPCQTPPNNLNVNIVQSCLTLCNPMDYTIHGILQARILEWVTFPFSKITWINTSNCCAPPKFGHASNISKEG